MENMLRAQWKVSSAESKVPQNYFLLRRWRQMQTTAKVISELIMSRLHVLSYQINSGNYHWRSFDIVERIFEGEQHFEFSRGESGNRTEHFPPSNKVKTVHPLIIVISSLILPNYLIKLAHALCISFSSIFGKNDFVQKPLFGQFLPGVQGGVQTVFWLLMFWRDSFSKVNPSLYTAYP